MTLKEIFKAIVEPIDMESPIEKEYARRRRNNKVNPASGRPYWLEQMERNSYKDFHIY